jgi:uncharacterized protein
MKMTADARAVLVVGLGVFSAAAWAGEYETEIGVWRSKRAAALQADGGWLSVAGLTWLKEGPNRFGTSAQNEIVLPTGSTPGSAGVFEFRDGKTTVSLVDGVKGFLGKSPVTATTEMKPDTDGGETLVIGDLTIQVIKRAERYGIRLRDRNSSSRKSFSGLKWYPVLSEWKIAARFVAYSPPRPVRISSVIGTSESLLSPGYAAFSVGGVEVKLDGVLEAPDSTSLFFIFRDQTSGKETYGGGRFLYADLPKQGVVVLDFNKAYNPPCAFTPYATCPVPPQQNWLAVAIPAGEKNYGGLAH